MKCKQLLTIKYMISCYSQYATKAQGTSAIRSKHLSYKEATTIPEYIPLRPIEHDAIEPTTSNITIWCI